MKCIPILIALFLITSAARAEVYKWEDSTGVHFTDNPFSVPEKYREKVYAETSQQVRNTSPSYQPPNAGIPQQVSPPQVDQEYLQHQQQAADVMMRQQSAAMAQTSKSLEKAIAGFAGFMFFWVLLGFSIFFVWIATIVDIVKSDFDNPSNKTVWILLVVLIPLLGMILYHLVGTSQKSRPPKSSTSPRRNAYKVEPSDRLRPNRDSKDFDIS
jgi:hypothetical protein